MGLLERVATLIRADLDRLVSNSQDPKRALGQVLLDIQNQMMQLKTQVAVSAGEEKSLRQKQSESAAQVAEWQRKTEHAAGRKDEHIDLGAKERLAKAQHEAASAEEQLIFQSGQLQKLRSALEKLDRKYREAQTLMRAMERPAMRTQKAVEPIPGTQVRGSVSDQNEIEKIISDLKEKVSNE